MDITTISPTIGTDTIRIGLIHRFILDSLTGSTTSTSTIYRLIFPDRYMGEAASAIVEWRECVFEYVMHRTLFLHAEREFGARMTV